MGKHIHHFSSLQDMQRHIDTDAKTWKFNAARNNEAEHSWDLDAGYEGALKLARDGWHEGGKAFGTGLAKLPTHDVEPDWQHDVAGFICDTGRFSAGMPDCMWIEQDNAEQSARPVITIAVNVCASASIRAQCFANYGMAIAHYIDEIERDGMRVELVAAVPLTFNGADVCFTWTVKDANQQMNLETVSFSIGHPACFRRLGFAAIERLPSHVKPNAGYGTCASLEAKHLPSHPGAFLLNGINSANSHSATAAGAYAHVQIEIEAARKAAEAK